MRETFLNEILYHSQNILQIHPNHFHLYYYIYEQIYSQIISIYFIILNFRPSKTAKAYKEIFRTEKLHDNLNNLNGEFKNNRFVKEIVDFINKDKKRPICTPFSK